MWWFRDRRHRVGMRGMQWSRRVIRGLSVYDSVMDLGWRVSLSNHRIKHVINDLLERYNETATCSVVQDCVDCYECDWVD